jgi:hypothetical protein
MRLGALFLLLLLVLTLLSGCLQESQEEEQDPGWPSPPGEEEDRGPVVWGSMQEAVIRPGAPIRGGCVFNWVFTDAEGNAYIGTAAHCTALGERLRERDSEQMVGTVIFDSDDTPGADPRLDFALVQLDPEAVGHAHPAMLGGQVPAGVASPGEVMPGDLVVFYGHGETVGDNEALRERMGFIVQVDEREYRANMPAVEGDSGSPVLHESTGKALGMVSRYGVWDALDLEVPTTDVGPMVSWILEELAAAGLHVELAAVD